MALIKTIAAAPGQECQHIEMTAEEEAAFLVEQSVAQVARAVTVLKRLAQEALARKDAVVNRCMEKGAPVPVEWSNYAAAARAIVNTGTGILPDQPAYPAET